MKKSTLTIMFVGLMILTSSVFAERGNITAHVTRVLVSDNGMFGGCMAFIDKDLATQASKVLSCTGRWITFSCSGEFNSKDIAYRKLDIAQKSEVTGHNAVFFIDDSKKHNGHCYAFRVDSLNN